MEFACVGLLLLGAPRPPLDKPNVVMLFVDDLGYGDVGFNGHPTTATPNIDTLAYTGRILTSWYSACPVCSCSRASLMTGRQWTRMGIPAVLSAVEQGGLPLNETTVAAELKKGGYKTGIVGEWPFLCARVFLLAALRRRRTTRALYQTCHSLPRAGKWHLGQRAAYLPAARGFDEYLGIPYSDDMGHGRRTPCDLLATDPTTSPAIDTALGVSATDAAPVSGTFAGGGASAAQSSRPTASLVGKVLRPYIDAGLAAKPSPHELADPAGMHLPLVRQGAGKTVVVEQPVDFTTLGSKYASFAEVWLMQRSCASP
jgi:arylsulfatase A